MLFLLWCLCLGVWPDVVLVAVPVPRCVWPDVVLVVVPVPRCVA